MEKLSIKFEVITVILGNIKKFYFFFFKQKLIFYIEENYRKYTLACIKYINEKKKRKKRKSLILKYENKNLKWKSFIIKLPNFLFLFFFVFYHFFQLTSDTGRSFYVLQLTCSTMPWGWMLQKRTQLLT